MLTQRSGRYRELPDEKVTVPGDLPLTGRRSAHVSIVHGAVADPNPAFKGKRQRVAINKQTDALEYEYARGRIDQASYQAGRIYQSVLERSRKSISGAGQWSPGNRVDMVISHELTVLSRIAAAEDAVKLLAETQRVVGMLGGRVLELVLVEGKTIKQIAELFGGTGTQQVFFWGETFRQSLKGLAAHWDGYKGQPPRREA